jgi:hypothetical protein
LRGLWTKRDGYVSFSHIGVQSFSKPLALGAWKFVDSGGVMGLNGALSGESNGSSRIRGSKKEGLVVFPLLHPFLGLCYVPAQGPQQTLHYVRELQRTPINA